MSWRDSKCSVSGCEDRQWVKKLALCQLHYHRAKDTGSVDLRVETTCCKTCRKPMKLIGSDRINRTYCSEWCRGKAKRKREKSRPEVVARKINYKYAWKLRQYGLTPAEYEELERKQDGCCAICGTHKDGLARGLVVDHDHNTGIVRGLLCRPCNAALGIFDDNPRVLESALAYLNAIVIDGDNKLEVASGE